MARLRSAYVASLLSISVILCGAALHVLAVTSCVAPDVLAPRYAWPVGAVISVMASNFPPSLQPCVQKAFDNWNAANGTSNTSGNGSGVKFNTVVFGNPVNTTNQTNVYQVTYNSTKPDGTVLSDPGVTEGQANAAVTNRTNATTTINTTQTTCDQVTVTTAHEIGHTMGAGDCSQCTDPSQSVMFGRFPPFSVPPYQIGPTPCDNTTVSKVYFPPPPPIPGCQTDCPQGSRHCIPCGQSPVIFDLNGHGFHLTSAADGVKFDISGTGNSIQMGWTASGADNAFLALPGADGLVHNGRQLFGNFTLQPVSDNPNGFIALAVYDDPKNGGNGDGVIDSRDAIFGSLRLWIDANHDGVSQPEELHALLSMGVNSISLKYRASEKTDQYGNVFRYRARVNPDEGTDVGKTAYDVFFVTLGQPISKNIPRSLIPADAQKCAVPVPTTNGGMLSSTGSL